MTKEILETNEQFLKRRTLLTAVTHLLQVHAFHRSVHPFDDGRHVARHLSHRDGSLHPARDCIDAAS